MWYAAVNSSNTQHLSRGCRLLHHVFRSRQRRFGLVPVDFIKEIHLKSLLPSTDNRIKTRPSVHILRPILMKLNIFEVVYLRYMMCENFSPNMPLPNYVIFYVVFFFKNRPLSKCTVFLLKYCLGNRAEYGLWIYRGIYAMHVQAPPLKPFFR